MEGTKSQHWVTIWKADKVDPTLHTADFEIRWNMSYKPVQLP